MSDEHMISLDDFRNEMRAMIQQVVSDEFGGKAHHCRFNVSDEEAKDLTSILSVMSSLGDGSLGRGIDVIRDNHRWLQKQRDRSERVSTTFMMVLLTALVGGILSAFIAGVRGLLTK